MKTLIGSLFASLLFIAFSVPSLAIINQIEAEVGETVISSRDIYINIAVEQVVFLNKKAIKFPQLDSKKFKESVSDIIVEALVFNEADLTIDSSVLPGPQKAKAVARYFKRSKHWKNIRPSLKEIQDVIDLKSTSKEVLKKRIELAKVPISDQEITAYYEQNKKSFAGLPVDKFKDNIKTLLSQKDIDEKLADWIFFLRAKYNPENIAASRE